MSLKLHFPPGTSNNIVTGSFALPVAVEATAILPHAHNLARQIDGYAILPNGKKEPLIRINDWDFRWQGDYRYVEPLKLPAGTKLHLQITYDNSTNNLRNPNNPPKLVEYGPQSSDEMCELWLQLLASSETDLAKLRQASEDHKREMFVDYFNARLQWYPNDPLALTRFGSKLAGERKYAQALENLQKAIATNPDFAEAHYELGVLYRMMKRRAESKRELETALKLNPDNSKAWGHLGFLAAEMGNARECERCFRKALEIDPTDEIVRRALEELLSKTR
jgi:tetratricopeptide (TPR) repeat protein